MIAVKAYEISNALPGALVLALGHFSPLKWANLFFLLVQTHNAAAFYRAAYGRYPVLAQLLPYFC
jgi:hypothetical protein